MNGRNYRIAVCGASGFVGANLTAHLTQAGHTVVSLGRELFDDGQTDRLAGAVAGCDAVINVAGVTIDHYWSRSYKRVMYESRVGVVRKLVAAIRSNESVRCWISVSAVGYYPSEGCYDESFPESGTDFLAALCRDWEAEALKAPKNIRTVITRFGVVLASRGGAFEKMSRPARMGIAVETGNGRQPFTWIDMVDLCRAMVFVLDSPIGGVINFTAPQRLTQKEAVHLIQKHYNAKIRVHIPGFLLRMVRGEAADFLIKGQCALPARLLDAGFEFRSPDLETFLARLPR